MSDSPRLIAIDCATLPASVALLDGCGSACELVHEDEQRADAWLGSAIDRCLSRHDLGVEDVDGFAACVGPGTFTGIRVGIATALGLAAPRGLPVCGVRSVDALALLGSERGAACVVACIDARRQQVYAALYGVVGPADRVPLQPSWGPTVCTAQEVARRVADREGTPLIIGSGAGLVAKHADRADTADGGPLAAAIGRLALRSWLRAARSPADWPSPDPLYLRPPDARPPRNPLLEARSAQKFEQPK